ncbi:MAG: T9SS type A sorting domain-containing protein [Ignavibacteriae bacterium]|nr:T9SS type A sorting domain-containing protein [Ignavibacteria bacterium]MBI3364399.1 T9SS type A sorting domain-containing protein [Ignavibacteriota bacterium]
MKLFVRYELWIPIIALLCVLLVGGPIAPVWANPLHVSSITLVDTPSFSIPFVVNENNYVTFAIHFGIHPRATKGIDAVLGEEEIPPPPPTFDARFGGPCGSGSCGQYLDLRPYESSSQIDTFPVGFNADDIWGFPFIFSWPDLTPYFSGSVRFKMDLAGSIFNVDMKAQHSYTLLSLPPNPQPWIPYYAYIIAEGPLPGTSLPVVSTYGWASADFEGIVHAPSGPASTPDNIPQTTAGTTSVWFDYGPTKTYGTSTTPQSVTDGTSANISEPFDPSSLPMNTRIHFRAVAQNTGGTFYGGDRIVSNGTPPPEIVDTSGNVKYRTAAYRDWADAKDQHDKRKSIKCKPDKVDFRFRIKPPVNNATLNLIFSVPTTAVITVEATGDTTPQGVLSTPAKSWAPTQEYDINLSYIVTGRGYKGSPMKASYEWIATGHSGPFRTIKGKIPSDSLIYNLLLLPMPNLHNVGEDIYGGIMQTLVQLTVGVATGPHSVYLPKYKDVLKSLVKEKKGGDLYHTDPPHCLNTFDKNHMSINKSQKGLPPDKHNNILFAEQLTLKLNAAASDSGIFPQGLGELIYSNATPFDNKTVREIMLQVDTFLSCPPIPPKLVADSSVYLKVVQDINTAFAGPMDTASWSCQKVICTGVKMLSDVPYLRANPNAVPVVFSPREYYPANGGPAEYTLYQNYPNPFNPTTTIEFDLPEDALVTLKVYNTLGQEVAELIHNEVMDAGNQEVEFDASTLSSGVYYYRIVAEDVEGKGMLYTSTKKMTLMK